MNKLIFYTNPQSRGRIAHWMLEEVGQPYETVWLEYGSGTKSAEYLAINPMGKIPALKHGNAVVTETAAICTYLAAAFRESRLMPAAGTPESAQFFRWLFFAAGPLEQSITARSLNWEVTDDRKQTVGFGSHEEVLQAITAHLQANPFVCGDRFSAADVYLGSHLLWGMAFGNIDKNEVFSNYAERLTARPAYQQAEAINAAKLES